MWAIPTSRTEVEECRKVLADYGYQSQQSLPEYLRWVLETERANLKKAKESIKLISEGLA